LHLILLESLFLRQSELWAGIAIAVFSIKMEIIS
jgi:hypothetical protein